jgi:diguanylate cyclase (GGDEF)-like protein
MIEMSPPPDSNRAKSAVKLRMLLGFGSLLLLSALLTLSLTGISAAQQDRRAADRWYVHTLDILIVTGNLKNSVNAAMRGERGYLLTGQTAFLPPYREGSAAASKLVNRLALMTRDNPRQRSNVDRLKVELDRYLATLAQAVHLQEQGRGAEALSVVRKGIGRSRIEAALGALARVEAEERRLLAQRRVAQEQLERRSEHLQRLMLALGALLLLIVALVGAAAAKASARAEEAVRELRRLATTDALTGLVNRRHFHQLLETEVARAERNCRPLSLALLDVDHFKRVNDQHGHPAGDAVLQAVAGLLSRAVRMGDVVARVGGEEFAVLMPDTDVSQAHLTCERLRQTIEAEEVKLENGRKLQITMSTGVALLAAFEGSTRLVSRADTALYEAKAKGRNQVQMAA